MTTANTTYRNAPALQKRAHALLQAAALAVPNIHRGGHAAAEADGVHLFHQRLLRLHLDLLLRLQNHALEVLLAWLRHPKGWLSPSS